MPAIQPRITTELGVKPAQVAAAVALPDEGSTVPFIARYRKEATGGLDDIQLRAHSGAEDGGRVGPLNCAA